MKSSQYFTILSAIWLAPIAPTSGGTWGGNAIFGFLLAIVAIIFSFVEDRK